MDLSLFILSSIPSFVMENAIIPLCGKSPYGYIPLFLWFTNIFSGGILFGYIFMQGTHA